MSNAQGPKNAQGPMSNDQGPMTKFQRSRKTTLQTIATHLGLGHWSFFGPWTLGIGHSFRFPLHRGIERRGDTLFSPNSIPTAARQSP